MRNTFLRSSLLGLLALSACADDVTSSNEIETVSNGTRIIRPASGALTAPSSAARDEIVREFLKQRGVSGADHLTVISEAAGRNGVTHVKLEQVIDGLRVQDAYVKAAIDSQGQLLQVIEKTATATTMAKPAVNERAALAATLAHLRYDGAVPAQTSVQGNKTRFFQAADFFRSPEVERVAYIDGNGTLRQGFYVETWFDDGNQLDYTLIDGSGGVVSSELRTANDRYNVFVEDPSKGAQTIVTGGSGWLGAGSQTTVNITGNNVHGYLDTKPNNNAPDSGGTAVTNGDFLTAAALGEQPSTSTNRNVAVQNLFYLNNVVHDALRTHGFNEANGNFQEDNFGLGGAGSDSVNAEAQDGGGTDNANFATPADGSNPRMQMYLWSAATGESQVLIGGGTYEAYRSSFGSALTTTGVTYPLALVNDGTGTLSDGCEVSTTSLSGKIALVDRGTCDFLTKVQNAASAGAKGVIIANNVGDNDAFAPGGSGRVRIPSLMVGKADGQTIRAQINAATTLRKNPIAPLQLDGDLDADIVFHEYGHGLTWRMIGSMTGPMSGGIGEGASDTLAFLMNGDDVVGEYSYSNPAGIRRHPYAGYPGTYGDNLWDEVHNDGEVYAAIMWRAFELYSASGLTASDLLGDFVDGMNFTPALPAYEDMRDGMLQSVGSTSTRGCLVWRAFAQFGVGEGVSSTHTSTSAGAVVESFAVPAACQ